MFSNPSILQLWVNLPAKHKNIPPHYIGLQKDEVPEIGMDGDKVHIQLVSGTILGHKAPIQSAGEINLCSIRFAEGGKLELEAPEEDAVLFYVVRGRLIVNGQEAEQHELVEFERSGSAIQIEAAEDSLILFGHAKPTNEPIAAHGPFVMNTQEEIRKAFVEYQQGLMGEWKD